MNLKNYFIVFELNEIWKDVIGYEGLYQVSNLGRIKSLERVILKKGKYPFICKERIMNLTKTSSGYLKICMYQDSRVKTRTIHQLVAESFLNHVPCGKKLVVNHKNFDRTDNRLENLEVVTMRENSNKKHIKSSSEYVGVSWSKINKKWKSQIVNNGKKKSLGYFENEYDAHLAYQNELSKL